MIYTVPVVNGGGGYNTETGVFTVPREGLYMFTIQMCTYNKKTLQLQIMAAGQIIEATSYNENSYLWSMYLRIWCGSIVFLGQGLGTMLFSKYCLMIVILLSFYFTFNNIHFTQLCTPFAVLDSGISSYA